MTKRRAITLLLVLTSLTLAAALIAPLAMMSGTQALLVNEASDRLRHRLAGDSLIAVLPEWLERDSGLTRLLDRGNGTILQVRVGEILVEALVQDDSAKLPVAYLTESSSTSAPTRLGTLSHRLGLEPLPSSVRRSSPGCLDDLFEAADDKALFGHPAGNPTWSHYLTTLGRSVNVARARSEVLEALLEDVQPGIGTKLARERDRRAYEHLEDLLLPLELTAIQYRRTVERLTLGVSRYSLLIRTTLGDVSRQRYVICSASEPPSLLVDWEVAP